MMLKHGVFALVFLSLILNTIDAKETFNEQLLIYPMPNRFHLLSFEYDFSIPLAQS